MTALPRRSAAGYRVTSSEVAYEGAIFGVRKDVVAFPDGTSAVRDIVTHGGAVAIVAIDDEGAVVLLEQYRHAVGELMWELPAGLLDVPGEPPLEAARRELAEEAGLAASGWATLVDIVSAPGFSNERVRVFLARGLTAAPAPADFQAEHEESDLVVRRVPLEQAIAGVHDGSIVNSIAVGGLLAAERAIADETLLRPAGDPWPGAG